MSLLVRAFAVCAALWSAACATPSRAPSSLLVRAGDGPFVAVKECSIPAWEPWYARFAVHSWIDYRRDDGRCFRIGVPAPNTDVRHVEIEEAAVFDDRRWEERVRVVRVLTGDDASAALVRLAELAASGEAWADGGYRAFPGPNSNTFVERLVRRAPGLDAQLSPNALGRDYAPFRAGLTAGGTGVELETPVLGAEVGLREGVQLHVLQLPIGVRLWPPAVLLPFLPALGPYWTRRGSESPSRQRGSCGFSGSGSVRQRANAVRE
ncbi:MAG: DUF3750 domain-containing protein [Planctomycetota bacterium]